MRCQNPHFSRKGRARNGAPSSHQMNAKILRSKIRSLTARSRIRCGGGTTMSKLAIWAQLEARPGKEKEVEEFLKSALPLAEQEKETVSWYAVKMGPGKYGIFDTFADEHGRNAHLTGPIAKALFAKADELFAKAPEIAKPEVLAAKTRN